MSISFSSKMSIIESVMLAEQEARSNIYSRMRRDLQKYREILNSKNPLLIHFDTFKAKRAAALTAKQNEEIDTREEGLTAVFMKFVFRSDAEVLEKEVAALGAKDVDAMKELVARWVETSALEGKEQTIFRELMALRFEIDDFKPKKKEEMAAFHAKWEADSAALVAKNKEEIDATTGNCLMQLRVSRAKYEEHAAFRAKKNKEFATFCAKKDEEYAALLAKEKMLEAEGATLAAAKAAQVLAVLNVETVADEAVEKIKPKEKMLDSETAALKAEEEKILEELAALKVQADALEAKREDILKKKAALQDAELPAE